VDRSESVGAASYGARYARDERGGNLMGVRIGQWTLDVRDVALMARF
jgi:hypothetical protein